MSDTSTLFDLLAADHRRRVLLLLCQTETVQMPESLQTRGGVRPRRGDGRPRRGDHRKQRGGRQPSQAGVVQRPSRSDASDARALDLQLTHSHLPRLEAEELIEWDRDAQTVTRGPRFEEIEPLLHVLAANADKFPDGLF